MEIISQREMRNNSGEILRRVAAGESLLVSNGGQLAAMVVPVPESSRDRLVAAGRIIAASRPLDVARWQAADLPEVDSSETVLAQLRGDR